MRPFPAARQRRGPGRNSMNTPMDGHNAGQKEGRVRRYAARIAFGVACWAVGWVITELPFMKPVPKAAVIPPGKWIARRKAPRDAMARPETGKRSAGELSDADQFNAKMQRREP